ncbi:hypothetical protein L798_08528 [Zootermopsis nevadensis]|uniref:Uncharacterized protein n=1 Tax=Zootermopsis nevadensis TaxID=136037 RepID=A0A067QH07_ZOONE|nr:hypothetical protein L798_08528 [Zootermopsis nevadensis]
MGWLAVTQWTGDQSPSKPPSQSEMENDGRWFPGDMAEAWCVREVLVQVIVLYEVAPNKLVEVSRCSRGAYCLHHQTDESTSTELHDSTFQKTITFSVPIYCTFRQK